MPAFRGVLALAARTLRIDNRALVPHGLRIALAGALFLALIGVQLSGSAFGAPGLRLYLAIVEIDFWLIGVLGGAVFAAIVADEREQGGLELMRLAGMTPLSIVLGRSIGQLVGATALLAVQLPFALLAVSLGGLDTRQVLAGFSILGGYLLFAFGAGMLCSTASRTVGAAARWTTALLAIASLWPFVAVLLGRVLRIDLVDSLPTELSPYTALGATGRTGYAELPIAGPVLGVCGLVAFIASWLGFGHFERAIERRTERRRRFLGFDSWGGTRRVPRWSASALSWKDYRVFVGGRRGLLLRGLAYAAVAVVLTLWFAPWRGPGPRTALGTAWLAMVVVGLVTDLGTLAARVFRDEARDGTYTSLLMLPKSIAQLVAGKVAGCTSVIVPALPFVAGAVALRPELVFWLLGPAILLFLAHLHMLLHLVALASLYVPRGAFALTTFCYVLVVGGATLLVDTFFGLGGTLLLQLVLPFVILFVTPKLRRRIHARLAQLAW